MANSAQPGLGVLHFANSVPTLAIEILHAPAEAQQVARACGIPSPPAKPSRPRAPAAGVCWTLCRAHPGGALPGRAAGVLDAGPHASGAGGGVHRGGPRLQAAGWAPQGAGSRPAPTGAAAATATAAPVVSPASATTITPPLQQSLQLLPFCGACAAVPAVGTVPAGLPGEPGVHPSLPPRLPRGLPPVLGGGKHRGVCGCGGRRGVLPVACMRMRWQKALYSVLEETIHAAAAAAHAHGQSVCLSCSCMRGSC